MRFRVPISTAFACIPTVVAVFLLWILEVLREQAPFQFYLEDIVHRHC